MASETTAFIFGSSVSCSDGPCGMGLAMAVGTGLGSGTAPRRISADRIPAGKAEVRAADHLLVAEGHLRGRRTVAIPISAVAGFGDGVRLSLTRDEVRDLPTAAG